MQRCAFCAKIPLTLCKYFAEDMRLPKILPLALLCLAVCSCDGPRFMTFSGFAQGGTWTVKANVRGVDVRPDRIQAAIDSILITIDTTLSGYNPGSMLSRLNAGEAVEKSPCFLEVEALAARYHEISGGAFDVAAGPLFDIWGFGFKNDSLPDAGRVAEAMALSRDGKVLNFNAIAQGYTADCVASYLKSIGVEDMLVDIGEIWCCGHNPSGKGWTIGIDTPTDGNNTPGASLSGIWESDGGPHGVVTSGNYRKFYVKDGVKYSHTIDPRTGYPVQHNLLSATVVAPTSAEADALATTFMVIGFEESKDFVLSHDELEACLITSDQTWRSPGF